MITITKAEPIGESKPAMTHLHVANGPHRWEMTTRTLYDETGGLPFRRVRVANHMTIREAATKAGVSAADLSGLEFGRHTCSVADWGWLWRTVFGHAPLTMADLCTPCEGRGSITNDLRAFRPARPCEACGETGRTQAATNDP